MDYKKLYASKLCTAKEAVKDVTSGDWVDYGWCTGHPVALDKALAERMPELEDVKIRGGIALWRPAIFDIENPADHFCWNSWHMSGIERHMIARGCAFYSPIRYSELPRYYRELDCPDDVAMFHVKCSPASSRSNTASGFKRIPPRRLISFSSSVRLASALSSVSTVLVHQP